MLWISLYYLENDTVPIKDFEMKTGVAVFIFCANFQERTKFQDSRKFHEFPEDLEVRTGRVLGSSFHRLWPCCADNVAERPENYRDAQCKTSDHYVETIKVETSGQQLS